MRKTILASSVALFALSAPAAAADLETERQLGLIVSGVVDQWTGVQIIDAGQDDDTVFTNGGEGRLSLPLGDNLSIQSDVKYEYNSNALESPGDNDVIGPRYSFQGAAHVSWRDPSSFLLGAFGGAGVTSFGRRKYDVRFIGGEAQVYLDDITLYAQGGYVDYANTQTTGLVALSSPTPDDGLFARGVLRWFLTPDSRIQIEGTYVNLDLVSAAFGSAGEAEIFSAGARYDFTVGGLPVIGDTPFYVAYRGTFRDNCAFGDDLDDHTFMVGTSYSFSGDMLTVDRQGATLDTPNFDHGCVGELPQQPSDRRLKTDIVALGETEDGIKLYSWKYKSDLVTTWVGVMAQDLEVTHPQALVTGADGFYRVNYSGLGVQMMTLEQWNARHL
ncbi:tail fiber domain-containing protein [Anderseniella sp. Alg231-50]|uniref:tail fiber domain-containing protein n=1 Tax=Anderseniella sp. Alg231-50 TaxID=1922226 RepID=UPI000D552C79